MEISKSITTILLDTRDSFDIKIHNDYSGRSMYGNQCFAVSGSYTEVENYLAQAIFTAGEEDESEILEIIATKCMDNYGLDRIVYFPSYLLNKEVLSDYEML